VSAVVIFAGPTLPAADIEARLAGATALPPAAVGDVARAARRRPRAIALVDGVFERVLPVWHKEILWAMARGVHVFGAASMGALRAAELHPFGMRGVGRVFEAYVAGELEADDEVAVLHGPAEAGFAAVTEALVNIRATLARVQAEGVLAATEAERLLVLARGTFYRERTWDSLLGQAADVGLGAAADRLRAWLPAGRVDLKREDALRLLDALAEFLAGDPPPLRVEYAFAWTDAWDALHARVDGGTDGGGQVLDELRLQPRRLGAVRRAALLRLLARREAERRGSGPDDAARQAAGERLRARLGLWRRADLGRWLAGTDCDPEGFAALVEDEAVLALLEREAGSALDAAMLDELRAGGSYAALAERARDKAARLATAGLDAVGAAEAEVALPPLLARLAERAEEAAAPAAGVDLAPRLGFPDRAALERAVLREQLYAGMLRANQGGAEEAPPTARPDGTDAAERDG
jgi:hypothetical protein